jgi:hypothetical protein
MLRGTHYIFTSRCNLSRSGRRITSFRNIAVYCAMNSRPCCNLAVLGRCDGSCPPRAASISPSFWQDGYEIPSKLPITPFPANQSKNSGCGTPASPQAASWYQRSRTCSLRVETRSPGPLSNINCTDPQFLALPHLQRNGSSLKVGSLFNPQFY